MRDIKFIAFDKKTKTMRLVNEIKWSVSNLETQVIIEVGLVFQRRPYIRWRKASEVELLQYIGLKDSKGEEVYEGFIVHSVVQGIQVIRNFIEDVWWFKTTMADFEDAEIIGNVYENPELLEKYQ